MSHLARLTEDSPTQLSLVKFCNTHIDDDGVPLHETGYKSSEGGVIPCIIHEDALSDVTITKNLNVVEGSFDEEGCKARNEAAGHMSNILCSPLPVHDNTPLHCGLELKMTYGRDQVEDVLLGTKIGDTITANCIHHHTKRTKYACATQTHGYSEVRIGRKGYISRWCRNSVLSYVVDEKSFPTPADAICVKEAMEKAICMWEGIGPGFKEVDCHDSATFVIMYHRRRRRDVYANSFYPDESPGELIVYELALSSAAYLANILAHEIGHILGLRHEFANKNKKERKDPSVLFGRKNSRSIMNYYSDLGQLRVTQQDLRELKALYAYNGEKYKGLRIYDYDPILHARVSREETCSSCAVRKSGRKSSRRSALRKKNSPSMAAVHSLS